MSTVNVTISDNQPSINPNTTSLDLSSIGSIGYLHDPGCESLKFTVRARNSAGEGAGSVVLYSQGTCMHAYVCHNVITLVMLAPHT